MNNFSKFQCDFSIENVLKESVDKSVYSALMKRFIALEHTSFEDEVIVIKILKTCDNEIKFLTSLKHQGIPKILMMWEEEDYLVIIQEKVIGLSLNEYVRRHENIPNNKRLMIAYDLAKILKYIHLEKRSNTVHGDISPNNIMISYNDEIFLIDFGSSFRECIVKKEKAYYGTKGYFSPIIVENPMVVSKGIDIYSFAMILKLLEIDKISMEGYELYKNCLDKSVEDNFDIDEIMDDILYILN